MFTFLYKYARVKNIQSEEVRLCKTDFYMYMLQGISVIRDYEIPKILGISCNL